MAAETLAASEAPSPRRAAITKTLSRRVVRPAAAVVLGLVIAGSADRLASGVAYRAHALVGLDDAAAPVGSRAGPDQAAFAPLTANVLARAASVLRDRGTSAAQPAPLERLLVAVNLASATSQDERLARSLTTDVALVAGPTPNAIMIEASEAQAARAAAISNAVAEAYIADNNASFAALRRAADAEAASRLQSLNDAADAAHRQLAAFSIGGMDPLQARSEATIATTAARTRLDAFRAVMVSGTPPLGAQAGLPPSIAPLQTDYLDLKRQLMDAQRSLGERHMTVIALEDGVRQSAKTLSAEWKRLTQDAEAAWIAARDREAALIKADATRDPDTRQALGAAHEAVRASEDALKRFQANLLSAPAIDGRHYRMIASASVPTSPSGLPEPVRRALSAMLGLAVAALCMMPRSRPPLSGLDAADLSAEAPDRRYAEPIIEPVFALWLEEPLTFEAETESKAEDPPTRGDGANETAPHEEAERHEEVGLDAISRDNALAWAALSHRSLWQATAALRGAKRVNYRNPIKPNDKSWPQRPKVPDIAHAAKSLRAPPKAGSAFLTLDDIVPMLPRLTPMSGAPCLVFVGSLESEPATGPVALALARAVAGAGQRVLLIEGERPRPHLAAVAALDVEPVLVDVLGTLKIALKADGCAGSLLVAPAFANLKRLAAGLARRDDVRLIEDPAAAFDLVIVDGGLVEVGTGEDWSAVAAASLRVARRPSAHEDGQFLAGIGGPFETFMGIVSESFVTDQLIEDRVEEHDPVITRPVFPMQPRATPPSIPHESEMTTRATARRRIGTESRRRA